MGVPHNPLNIPLIKSRMHPNRAKSTEFINKMQIVHTATPKKPIVMGNCGPYELNSLTE